MCKYLETLEALLVAFLNHALWPLFAIVVFLMTSKEIKHLISRIKSFRFGSNRIELQYAQLLDNTKTIPSLDNTKTIPSLDNTKTIPSQDNARMIPSRDNDKRIRSLDNTKKIYLRENKISQEKKISNKKSNPEMDEKAQELIEMIVMNRDIEKRENIIRRGLNDINQKDSIDVLIKYFAAHSQVAQFERVYRLIFSSQIALLKEMNMLSNIGMKKNLIQRHFDIIIQKSPGWSMDQYLNFLIKHDLITPIRPDGAYKITIGGKEFLKWIGEKKLKQNQIDF